MDVETVRRDFPILQREIDGKPIVYLDSACMSLKPDCVVDAVTSYYTQFPACGGRGRSAHALGRELDEAMYAARESIRRFINAAVCERGYIAGTPTREVIFTRNATEAINIVARGFPFSLGAVVLTTDKEHNSNLCIWQELAAEGHIRHLWVPSHPDGTFNLDAYAAILERENVELVSMVHVSNLDGYELPAADIIEMAHAHGARVLLDGAQSAPHVRIDVQALDVDFMALSLHKLCGPTGVGALYGKEDLLVEGMLRPLVTGGDTVADTTLDGPPEYLESPFRFEAGLQDYAGIIGAGAAADYIAEIGLEAIGGHITALNTRLQERLEPLRDEFDILGPADPALRSGITTLCCKRRGIVSLLDDDISGIGDILSHWANIMVRTGEFCVHSWFASHGISREREKLRASLYLYNTEADCNALADALEHLITLGEYQMLPKIS